MFEECSPQIRSMPDPGCGLAGLCTHGRQILADVLGHVRARQVTPKILHWVEFWGVGRQILHGQPVLLLRNPSLYLPAAMRWQPVPQQHHSPSANVSLERLQVRQHHWLLDRPRLKTQAQPHAPRRRRCDQAGDRRQTFPIERRHQDRCLPARRPSPTHARAFRETAFIQENQQRPAVTGLFLILGQRYRNQRLMASSLRSRALRSGRWQLQPNCPRTFQT